ncbi:hypothetical protein [Modestobacter versicolor]|uniref:hypothetical protein n=1 Tax=Modestobacter versicolor TaxID=429133 RepID=UPI0034DEAB69
MSADPTSRLRILYRHYGGDNDKPRPEYYSKMLALASMLRAVEALDVEPEIVYINDAVSPGPILSLMEQTGEVVPVRGGSDAKSYRAMIDREVARPASPDQFLWFSEDDYLYRRDALQLLTSGLAALPGADYVTMYGSRSLDVASSGPRAVSFAPGGAEGDPGAAITVDGVQWYRAFASTSTYGTRLGTLREDRRLLVLCANSGGPWDRTTSQVLAGYRPFGLAELREDVLPRGSVSAADRGKGLARAAMRVAVTARSLRRQSRRRTLFAADPELISHMEVHDSTTRTVPSAQSAATDWAAIAAETVNWAEGRGIAVTSRVS